MSAAGAVVRYVLPLFSDYVPRSPLVEYCSPAPASMFPLGNTPVSCTVVNAKTGLTSDVDVFNILVADLTPPIIPVLVNQVVHAQSKAGSIVNYVTPNAIDNVDGSVVINCTPPGTSGYFIPIECGFCSSMSSP